MPQSKFVFFTTALFATIAVVYLLVIGKDLILPLVIASLLFYILVMVPRRISEFKICGKQLPSKASALVTVIAAVTAVYALFRLAAGSIYKVVNQAPFYQAKLNGLLEQATTLLAEHNVDATNIFDAISIPSLVGGVADTFTSFTQYATLIVIYTLFIALEYPSFDRKLKALYPSDKSYDDACNTLDNITQDVGKYLKIKSLMSFMTGLLSYAVLAIAGISYAPFWGLVIFALNFIPTVGSILAILMVVPVVIIQLGLITGAFVTAAALIGVQLMIGNVIEPRLMGKSLNLSPLVILLSLAFWGTIWGPIGALLCVPLMVILNITLSKFEQTRSIAIMLSQEGRIRETTPRKKKA
ncbi:MAG: hypothetical protein CMF62_08035 [Magnetococcales bacterium]|nr:hypothetical protein [Magnetococcales bacterium]